MLMCLWIWSLNFNMTEKKQKPTRFILNFDTWEPVPCEDVIEWCKWFEDNRVKRILKVTKLSEKLEVRTAFLGSTFDLFYKDRPDDLFGTMVLRKITNPTINEQYVELEEQKWFWEGDEEYFSATKDEAFKLHDEIVTQLEKNGL